MICQTQRLKAKVTLLLWLLREKLRVPRWKSWTTFHVYWVSHPCPHTLSPSPGLPSCPPSLYHYHSCPSSRLTGLFRARIVSCLHSSASRLAPGSLFPQTSVGFHGQARRAETCWPRFKTAHALTSTSLGCHLFLTLSWAPILVIVSHTKSSQFPSFPASVLLVLPT